jgi:hypothetical protein
MSKLTAGSSVAAELAAADVMDAEGRHLRLGTFWQRGPCLVIFIRHFACLGCAEQVAELSPRLPEGSRGPGRGIQDPVAAKPKERF